MSFSSSSKYINIDKDRGRYSKDGTTLKESPYDRCTIFGKNFLLFMLPLFTKGFKRPLKLEDIGEPPKCDLSKTLGLKLQKQYNKELLNKKKPSFACALLKTFGPELAFFCLFDIISKCIALPMQTISLGWLIQDSSIYLAKLNPPPNVTVAATTNITTPVPLTPIIAAVTADDLTLDGAYWNIIYDAGLLLLFTMLSISTSHPFFFQSKHIGMKARIAACYMIYKKSLKLSQSAMSQTTVGQMVNLLSNDVNRFDLSAGMIPYLVVAPFQAAIIITILLVLFLGLYPTLAALTTIIVYVLIQTVMGRGFSKFRATTAKRTDERVRLMNEIILAMRIIKMYGWEKPFKQLVYAARKREITTIGIASLLRTINQTLFFVASKIIVFVALITYVLLGNSFNPQMVFVSIGLANLVRISLTLFFPNAIAYFAECIISCRRINTFLLLPEIESSPACYKTSTDLPGNKYVITMNKVYASWASKNQELTATSDARWAIIRNLNLIVKNRDLVLIVGRVGSGKSSVLMSLLGELPIASGRLEINGKISYASQEAWIFSGTVKENILFGQDYREDRYREVIRVCSLRRDLEILVDGDETIVGERGVSLSGGQKARVNLARALYREADIYILDDPLSAVDAPVAKSIFNDSLRTFLKKKTVVLATHQLQFLRFATKVLVVDRDQPAVFGTLQEVMESEAFSVVNYSKDAFEDATTTETGTDAEFTDSIERAGGTGSPEEGIASSSPTRERLNSSEKTRQNNDEDDNEESERLLKGSTQASTNLAGSVKLLASVMESEKKSLLIEQSDDDLRGDTDTATAEQEKLRNKKKRTEGGGSERRQGTESLSGISADVSTYVYYIRNAAGAIMLIWFLLINLATQGFYQFTDFFLSYWTDSVQRQELQGAAFVPTSYVDHLTTGEISSIYAILVALCFFTAFLRTATFFIGTFRASINIHDKLFNSVVSAPMSFFDFSPIGILLNRLSRDIGFVDETLPTIAIEIVTIFVNVIGILVLANIIDYTNLPASVVLFTSALLLRSFCARTVVRLKQIEGVTRSPIFSQISTTLSGLPTIRAFKVQDDFTRMFDKHQDVHSSTWFNYICSSQWLSMAMDWLCFLFILVVMVVLLTVSLDSNNASLVGLLISQAVVLPGPFQWGIRQLIEVESQMTSVQRIREFSELEPEMDLKREGGGGNEDDYHNHKVRELANEQSIMKAEEQQSSYQQGDAVQVAIPHEGEVKFINLSLSYFVDEPPVLKGLNFTIKKCEKVGIVGRTGAGKSSIVSVLFRLYNFDGSIEIDGVDTKSMSLRDLRRSMSIIPQDPILFGGTIRKNLDPFAEYSDNALWLALEAVQLKSFFARNQQGLEYVINEGGANFSVGQRQLICLARAIVRRNKILILDEATANVDPETDVFIQRTISQQFAQCTVITIAHRLITIVDSDRVLVLDSGQVREFDAPYKLIEDPASLFAQMVDSSTQQAARLRKLIQLNKEKRALVENNSPPAAT